MNVSVPSNHEFSNFQTNYKLKHKVGRGCFDSRDQKSFVTSRERKKLLKKKTVQTSVVV